MLVAVFLFFSSYCTPPELVVQVPSSTVTSLVRKAFTCGNMECLHVLIDHCDAHARERWLHECLQVVSVVEIKLGDHILMFKQLCVHVVLCVDVWSCEII